MYVEYGKQTISQINFQYQSIYKMITDNNQYLLP